MAKTGRIEVEIIGKSPNHCVFPLPEDPQEAALVSWWLETAHGDIMRTLPKMTEYGGGMEGSADLQLMGENLATLLDMHDTPDSVKQEMACWFYLQGKIARLVSDYKAHRPGKGDTWFDAEVYAKMARRIQETGQWP